MALDKTRLHHQKSLTKTRKAQRIMKSFGRQEFVFTFYNLDTGTKLGTWSFSGFDSEEAFVNANAWAARNKAFNSVCDIHCEQES